MHRSVFLAGLILMCGIGPAVAEVNDIDKAFVPMAVQANMTEIQEAQLAEKRAGSNDVKLLAQRIIRDHSGARGALEKITGARPELTEPAKQSPEQRGAQNRLDQLDGAEFDKAYVQLQVERHEKLIPEFEQESERGTDLDLRAFAVKQLPGLREHLEMARKLSAQMANR